jgi:hypothetical protein
MLTSIETVEALMTGFTEAEIEKMEPARRQRLAQVLRRIADMADPQRVTPTAGVLQDLSRRPREG